jgi:hypothetical protein
MKYDRKRSSFFRSIDEIRRRFAQEKLEEDFLLRLESSGRKIISQMIVIGCRLFLLLTVHCVERIVIGSGEEWSDG